MRSLRNSLFNGIKKLGKKFGDSLSIAAVVALAFNPLLPLVEFLPAEAASTPSYSTNIEFNQSEIDNWIVDRAVPSGDYGPVTFNGRSNVLEMLVDNNNANTSSVFHQTEGLKRALPADTEAVRADLYIDSDWSTKDVRAGMWGVGADASGSVSAYPIIEFTTVGGGGHEGWRSYNDETGVWTNHSTPIAWDEWNTVEIIFDHDTTKFDLTINGNVVGSNAATGSVELSDVILNNFNYATNNSADDYAVHWSSLGFGSATPDTTTSYFVNDPKYVRANNGGDLTAQLVTPTSTDDVRFYVNDNVTSIPGNNIGGAGATTDWWRLRTPLPAGEHTVSAEVKISGDWYQIDDTGIVYSLDTPEAEYITPSTERNSFRGSDNPVRVKVEDEFNQFKRMEVEIGLEVFEVLRSQCDDRQTGNYLLCDVDASTDWSDLSEGTYSATTTTWTQINNRVDGLESLEFTVDNTQPAVISLDAPSSVKNSLPVTATAEDTPGAVESVNFYVTPPRESDGVCTGNGEVLASDRVSVTNGSGEYVTTLDVSSVSDGEYCINAVARDNAMNNSAIVNQKFIIDTTAPDVPNAMNPNGNTNPFYTSDAFTQTWSDESATGADKYEYLSCYQTTEPADENCTSSTWTDTYTGTSKHVGGDQADSHFFWHVRAVDAIGNESDWSEWREIIIDSTNPVAEITNPSDGDIRNGVVSLAGEVTDDYPMNSYFRIEGPDGYVETSLFTDGRPTHDFAWDTTGLDSGEYTVYFEARDKADNKDGSRGDTSGDSVDVITITVDNGDPIVNAGDDTSLVGLSHSLDGFTGDNDSFVDSTLWELVAGPGTEAFGDETNEDTTVSVSEYGEYTFRLTAIDHVGNTSFDEVTITFSEATVDEDRNEELTEGGRGGATDIEENRLLSFTSQGTPVFAQTGGQVLSAQDDNTDGDNNDEQNGEEESGDVLQDQDDQSDDADDEDSEEASNFWWWLLFIALLAAGAYYAYSRSQNTQD